MSRKTVLTPRMEAEIAVAEIAKQYRSASDRLDDCRRAKVKAAEMVSDSERNLATFSKLYDETYTIQRDLKLKLNEAEQEYLRLEDEFATTVSAKLLADGDES